MDSHQQRQEERQSNVTNQRQPGPQEDRKWSLAVTVDCLLSPVSRPSLNTANGVTFQGKETPSDVLFQSLSLLIFLLGVALSLLLLVLYDSWTSSPLHWLKRFQEVDWVGYSAEKLTNHFLSLFLTPLPPPRRHLIYCYQGCWN